VSFVAPGSSDPFTRLGIDPCFALDLAALDARQRELGRSLHPDRHAGAPAAERRRVLGQAMDVNAAYRQLKDPVSRTTALLERLGISAEQTQGRRESPEFLMQVLEERDALGEARQSKDLEAVRRLGEGVARERARIEAALAELFDRGALASALRAAADLGPADRTLSEPAVSALAVSDTAVNAPAAEAITHAIELLGRLRYARRFMDEVASIEDEIG
jgi:molecular chaperone HscB